MGTRAKNPIREQLEEAARIRKAAVDLDERRQRQIANQMASITRLLVLNEVGPDPDAAANEIVILHHRIAELEQLVARVQYVAENYENERLLADELKEALKLPGATVAGGTEKDMGKRRDAFIAGFEAGKQPKAKRSVDGNEEFDAYKESLEADTADEDDDTDDDE